MCEIRENRRHRGITIIQYIIWTLILYKRDIKTQIFIIILNRFSGLKFQQWKKKKIKSLFQVNNWLLIFPRHFSKIKKATPTGQYWQGIAIRYTYMYIVKWVARFPTSFSSDNKRGKEKKGREKKILIVIIPSRYIME